MQAWRWTTVAALVAVAVQLYGVYRATGPPSTPLFPQADKLEHLLGFGLPTLLILLSAALWRRAQQRPPSRLFVTVVVVVSLVHAVLSEIIQHVLYPTTRSGDPLDVLADWVGVGLGVLGYRGIMRAVIRRAGGT